MIDLAHVLPRKPRKIGRIKVFASFLEISFVYGNQDNAAKSSERVSQSGSAIKAPTAPWVKGPLLLEPNQLRNFLQDLEKIPPQMKLNNTLIRPWLVPGKEEFTTAELVLDGILIKTLRVRGEAAITRKWAKVKKAGVTQAVVDQIHFIWKNNELALIKFDLPLCQYGESARDH
ncbi:chloroplastic group IIA intron splicing facilitator CRS1, chloroplastic isoform X1 [Olea europaea subsp. europaea]|uniref:Chloroplastic group IIA intron splicing facilitator CRS1, chloroplastic isoform X1 n=1 Tax=Olea europaea subsp. europaea TaxID=158383 RepID=A0A8S0PMN5_OLEEU|nr:chloroplastic group IIA intron splicing facilitator CRS1, chloroplastic isoform X1 [Olea europaea subsp. europaea]